MRTIRTTTLALFAFAVLAFAPGCGTFNSTAYKSIGSLEATVDKAMIGWADYVQWRKCQSVPTTDLPAQELKVSQAYTTFRTTADAVYDARALYVADKASGKVAWQAALLAAGDACSKLTALIDVWVIPNKKAIAASKAAKK
jgi:hypothetical protein